VRRTDRALIMPMTACAGSGLAVERRNNTVKPGIGARYVTDRIGFGGMRYRGEDDRNTGENPNQVDATLILFMALSLFPGWKLRERLTQEKARAPKHSVSLWLISHLRA
jgi:hypothetical protein